MKIVATGRGQLTPNEEPISRFSLDFTGQENPSVLLIPTARPRPELMAKSIEMATDHFGSLGVNATPLYETFDTPPTLTQMEHEVSRASMIFGFAGDTETMIRLWRGWGLADFLIKAAYDETVMAGGSAGAIAWFEKGHSDSESYQMLPGMPWQYKWVDALGIYQAIVCPHYDIYTDGGEPRRESLRKFISTGGDPELLPIYGIENNAALVIDGETVGSKHSVTEGHVYEIDRASGEAVGVIAPYGTE